MTCAHTCGMTCHVFVVWVQFQATTGFQPTVGFCIVWITPSVCFCFPACHWFFEHTGGANKKRMLNAPVSNLFIVKTMIVVWEIWLAHLCVFQAAFSMQVMNWFFPVHDHMPSVTIQKLVCVFISRNADSNPRPQWSLNQKRHSKSLNDVSEAIRTCGSVRCHANHEQTDFIACKEIHNWRPLHFVFNSWLLHA